MGYVPDAPAQSADVVFTIKTMHALLPATLNAIGLGLMWWYPLSEARHAAVQRAVQAQAQGKAVVDPVTGTTLPPPQSRTVSDDVAWQLDYFSPNELAHMAEGGWRRVSAALATRIAAWGVLSVALLASVVPQLGALDQDPGALPALTIVLAGLTLTASLFHAARAPALWRMRRAPMSPATVLAHLESVAPQAPATMRLRVASVVQ